MTIAELALLITTLSGAIVALINTRANSTAIGKLQEQLIDAQDKQQEARKDIVMIGEQLHFARLDNAIIAEGFNQLFAEFRDVTGHKPAVNLDRLKHLQTISYITGPLEDGPLDEK
jgi:chorismate mutase